MGYQQNDRNYNNNNNGGYNNNRRNNFSNNRQDRPRNKSMTFKVELSGLTLNGRNYNIQSAIDLLNDLMDFGTFSKLSVPVQISRATIDGNAEARGNINVGYVKSFSSNISDVEVIVYANCIERLDRVGDLVLVPRLLINREENVDTVLGFDLISK